MGKLALIDVVRPYFFLGVDVGPGVQDILEFLFVESYESSWDDDGVAVWGVARIDATSTVAPTFKPFAGRIEFELRDASINFRLTAARLPAASLVPADLTDVDVNSAVTTLGPSAGTAPSDYPNTQFRLDLLFNLVTITFPRLDGAKREGAYLVPDPHNPKVKIDLPRILLRIDQDSANDTDVDVDVASWGAETLDGADEAIASLIRMRPTYALTDGKTFGIGFEKAVIDFSDTSTPPDLMEKFGIGDDFRGIHLPEFRLFFADDKASGTAWNTGVSDLVLGLAPELAVWGDLSFDIDFRGDALSVGLRLYSVFGQPVPPTKKEAETGDPDNIERYSVNVPSTAGPETENYLLYIDIHAGAAPFGITVIPGIDHGDDDPGSFPADDFFDTHPDAQDLTVLQRTRLFSHDQRVAIRVTSRNPAQSRYLLLEVHPDRQTAPVGAPQPSVPPGATLDPPHPRIRVIDATNEERVDLEIDPLDATAPGATITVNGNPVVDGRVRIQLAAGDSQTLDVDWSAPAEGVLARVAAYFRFNEPAGGDEAIAEVSATPLSDGSSPAALDFSEFRRIWHERAAAGAPPSIRIDAYASREDERRTTYNQTLATRRSAALRARVAAALAPVPNNVELVFQVGIWGEDKHPSATAGGDPDVVRMIEGQVPGDRSADAAHDRPNYTPEAYRAAVVSFIGPVTDTDSYSGNVVREDDTAEQPERVPPPQPPASEQPDWLRSVGGTIRWERSAIPIGAEARMTIDIQTAHEDALEEFRDDIENVRPGLEAAEEDRLPDAGSAPNPDDGVVDFRLTITYDPSTSAFTETFVARSGEGDRDGLWSWGEIPTTDDPDDVETDGWRDILGLYFTLAPLTAQTAADEAGGGNVVPLVVALTTPVAVTALGVAHVLRFTHYGVELAVAHDADEARAALLFDVESAIWLDLRVDDFQIVTNRPSKPIKVRYKAVGFLLDFPVDEPTRFLPTFDSSRGYTIDLADSGSLQVLPSLGDTVGDIIQVLGARIARTNPLNMEVDLGLGVDLGVFKVDTFGFRLPIDPLGPPTITAIGISVDIPDTIVGSGYLKILATGFEGQLDVSLPSIGLRVAGGLRIQTVSEGDRSATGVVVMLAVEFPGGIPLGGTGLSIFGFLGLFAMHHRRLENPAARNPALTWLVDTVQGDPTRITGWGPALDSWAFGVGVVAGTIEGGTILNVKGMLVVEGPGPRVLLFVKANLLSAKPPTRGTATGALFAVLDVSPGRLVIGIQIKYEIEAILDIQIPVEAGFFAPPVAPPDHFYVDVGSIASPVKAKVLELFDATGYLMVHGDGISDFPLVAGGLQGFSLATGFKVSMVWGNTDIGLYVKVAGGFDAGVGFAPFFFAGRVYFDGSLHLFIVSLDVHAEISMLSNGQDTLLSGEICGRVSFLFFSVKGCVDFRLGTDPAAPHAPEPIRDLTLQSRSPALVEGTAVDRGVDDVLCHGTDDGSVPVVDDGSGTPKRVFVPIDAIPLLQFELAPRLDPGAIDGTLSGSVPAGDNGWQKRGPNFVRYTIDEIELRLVSIGGSPPPAGLDPTGPGPRPYTWRRGPQAGGSDGLPVDLAILDWKPTNVDKAMLEGPALDAMVDDRWEHVCRPVAEPAAVLWTFRLEPLGPSPIGWRLDGIAWPDPDGTHRSVPVDTGLRVVETWRTGTFVDGLLPHKPAEVVGTLVRCPNASEPEPEPEPQDPIGLRPRDRIGLRPRDVIGRRPIDDLRRPRAPRGGRVRFDALLEPGSLLGGRDLQGGAASAASESLVGDALIGARAAVPLCPARVLEAPAEVLADSLPPFLADSELGEVLRDADERRDGELRDVVRITGGPHISMQLLILAPIKLVNSGLMAVRAYRANGTEITGVSATFQHVTSDGDLPGTWRSTAGPWWSEVELARGFGAALASRRHDEFLVDIHLPEAAWHVDIGISPLREAIEKFGLSAPTWYLEVIEGLSVREVDRHDDDSAEGDADADGIEVGIAGNPHALLHPDARYDVVVHYTAEIGRKPIDPDDDEDPNEIIPLRGPESGIDSRTFFTDAHAPRSLEPWMLAQFPAPDEPHHFYEDSVVFVFAADDVLELFAAYDRTLGTVARAASFRGSAGTPEAPLTNLALDPIFTKLGTVVPSPYEATVRRHLGVRPCVDLDPDSENHGRAVAPFLLDPLTDYVIDIEARDPADHPAPPPALADEVGVRPLYRRRMTTSRYASREAMAEAVRTCRFVSAAVPDSGPLTALGGSETVVSDDEFDLALMAAGLEVTPRPSTPRVTKLWTTAEPAEPVALLIETPEPLWRSRQEPEPDYAPDGIHIERWRLVNRTWLSVDELVISTALPVSEGGPFVQSSIGAMFSVAPSAAELRDRYLHVIPPPLPPAPPPAALVTRFVRDESGARTLVLLTSSAVGRTVTLGLARTLHPLLDLDTTDTAVVLCEVDLTPPPWEGS